MISSLFRLISRKHPHLDTNAAAGVSAQFFNAGLPAQGALTSKPVVQTQVVSRNFSNCNRASITRVNRLQYLRQYPTLCVNPDGSTFTIRYQEPRRIIKLPVDLSLLSESARNARLERRKLKTKVKLDEEFDDEGFDAKKYLKYVKK